MAFSLEGNLKKGYGKGDRIAFRKLADECKVVILDLKNGDFYSLEDEISVSIWDQMMAGSTLSEILADLAARYPDQSENQIQKDLTSFVAHLLEHRLIVEWASAAPRV